MTDWQDKTIRHLESENQRLRREKRQRDKQWELWSDTMVNLAAHLGVVDGEGGLARLHTRVLESVVARTKCQAASYPCPICGRDTWL